MLFNKRDGLVLAQKSVAGEISLETSDSWNLTLNRSTQLSLHLVITELFNLGFR